MINKESITIPREFYIQQKLEKSHRLREVLGLINGSNSYVIENALDMYIRRKEREIKLREKKKLKTEGDNVAKNVLQLQK